MTETKQTELLIKGFMDRKGHDPVDVVIDVLGSADMFYKRVTKRLYLEALDMLGLLSPESDPIVFRDHPGYKEEDGVDLYVEAVYVDPVSSESYFSLMSKLPALENKLPHLRFNLNAMPFLAKVSLGLKLKE